MAHCACVRACVCVLAWGGSAVNNGWMCFRPVDSRARRKRLNVCLGGKVAIINHQRLEMGWRDFIIDVIVFIIT